MALLAQGFDPSGYTPSYAVSNAANEQMFQNQQQGIGTLVKGINDAQKEQKDLAQKDKEMAAKIKGTMSLLDNAKGIYTEFAPQIDAMKVQLADPSISNLDKAALSDQVTNSLNMFAQVGTEGVKTKLMEAQIKQAEAQTEAAGKERTTGTIIQDGKPVTVYGTTDIRTNKFIPDTVQEQNATSNVSDLTSWVAGLEGFNPKAYSDSGQTSIGYGTRAMKGESQITPEEAKARLESELGYSANRIDSAITQYGANLNPNQRKALVSFDFNTGKGADLIRRYANDPAGLRSKMLEYNKLDSGDKSPSKGLMNRRASEVNLFDTPYTTQQTEAISNASQMPSGQPAAGTADLIAGSQLISGIGQQGQPAQQGQPVTGTSQTQSDRPATRYVEVPLKPAQVLTPAQEKLQQLDINAKEVQIAESQAKKAEAENNAEIKSKAEDDKKYATVKAIKNTYDQILEAKNHPEIRQAFGIPAGVVSTGLPGGMVTSRLIPGTGAADARARVNGIIANSWVKSVIDAKAQGATFGALSDSEGAKLAQAATLLASSDMIKYDTANKEMQKMLEGLKESYKRLTGSDLTTATEVPVQAKTVSPAAAAQSRIDAVLNQ